MVPDLGSLVAPFYMERRDVIHEEGEREYVEAAEIANTILLSYWKETAGKIRQLAAFARFSRKKSNLVDRLA